MRLNEIIKEPRTEKSIWANIYMAVHGFRSGRHVQQYLDEMIGYVNEFNPPSLKAQQYLYDEVKKTYYADEFLDKIKDIQKPIAQQILTNDFLIKKLENYDNWIRRYFKDNQLLANKWLRYAEAIRNEA